MRLTVSPLVLAVSLGLLNASALDAELPEDEAAESGTPAALPGHAHGGVEAAFVPQEPARR